MNWRRAAIILCVLGLPSGGRAQVFSEQELDYLRDAFIESIANSVDGSFVQIGTLPPNRIQGTVPATKLAEADPAALPVAQAAASAAASAQADVDALETTVGGTGADVAAVEARVDALETKEPVWDTAATQAAAWDASTAAQTTFTSNIVFGMTGYTVTLYIANGIITNALQEGP